MRVMETTSVTRTTAKRKELHYQVWDYIVKNPFSDTYLWPGWDQHDKGLLPNRHCFACEEHLIKGGAPVHEYPCKKCPIIKKAGWCYSGNSTFRMHQIAAMEGQKEKARKYATIIRDAWEDEV